jgi:hypothetical protein
MRVPGWWSFAESVLSHLTAPPDDVAPSDRHVERVLTGSRVFGFGRAVSAAIERAWTHSWLRAAGGSIAADMPGGRRERIRSIAVLILAAALTFAMLRLLAVVVART